MSENKLATVHQAENGVTILGNIDGENVADRIAIFNALADADSLAELGSDSFDAIAVVQQPSERVDSVTGEVNPCTSTIFVQPDGHALFTNSTGIARAVSKLAATLGDPTLWPDGHLTFQVTSRDLGKSKTVKSVRIVS